MKLFELLQGSRNNRWQFWTFPTNESKCARQVTLLCPCMIRRDLQTRPSSRVRSRLGASELSLWMISGCRSKSWSQPSENEKGMCCCTEPAMSWGPSHSNTDHDPLGSPGGPLSAHLFGQISSFRNTLVENTSIGTLMYVHCHLPHTIYIYPYMFQSLGCTPPP